MDTHALWQATLDNSPIGQCLIGPSGELLAANPAMCRMLGYTEVELQARTVADITYPDDVGVSVSNVDVALAGSASSYQLRKRYVHADGHPVWVDVFVAVVRDVRTGEVQHLVAHVMNIEAEVAHRRELEATLERLRHQRRATDAVFDAVDIALALIAADGTYEATNDRWSSMQRLAYPYGHGGVAGEEGHVFSADGTSPVPSAQMPSVRAIRGEEFDDHRIWIGADPTDRRALSVSARTVRDGDGAPAGAVLAYKDVTALVAAIRARDQLLAAVSHELRSPLTSVTGHLEMLHDEPDIDPAVRARVAVAHRNALRLERQVSNLLDAAQFERRAPRLELATVDLVVLLTETIDSIRATADHDGVTLHHRAPTSLTCVVDASRMSQVFDNLISNAVKYSSPGSAVDIALTGPGDEFALEVADDGVGITPDDAGHVFEPFFRSEQALRSGKPGVGLGLAICHQIVAAHAGELTVAGRAGGGTVFRVRCPRAVTGTLDGSDTR